MENHDTQNRLQVKFHLKPGATAAEIDLLPHQNFTAEGGAMIAMSPFLQMSTSTRTKKSGGIMRGIKRMISGENFFLNHYSAQAEPGKVWLGTTHIGDMFKHELYGESLIVQGGSYVASSGDIELDFSWQGFKNIISKESLFWVKLSGNGSVVLNSFGAVYPIYVDGEHIVDTGHIVAFEETLNFSLNKVGDSWIGSFLGGEGLVCKFYGKGTVWVQSHLPGTLGMSLGPKLKPR